MSGMVKKWASWLAAEGGLTTLLSASRDTKILCLQRFVRHFAYGSSFLILVQFLSSLEISDDKVGLFMTLTLAGDTVISTVLTAITDKVGRRRVLMAGAALMVVSGIAFLISQIYWILLLASIVGVISPGGNEIGPFRAIEESILAQLTDKEVRSDVFAWYTLCGTGGAAIGTLTSGWLIQLLQDVGSFTQVSSYRAVFLLYAALGIIKFALVCALSPAAELQSSPSTEYRAVSAAGDEEEGEELLSNPDEPRRTHPPRRTLWQRVRDYFPEISPQSRSTLYRLLLLFFLDSTASGMASPSWLTYFFTTVHSVKPGALGTLFLVTNLLAMLSNLAALPVARRIGPLKTMIFTHLPSAVFLCLIPWPPVGTRGTLLSMAFLTLRASTSSMDQAPRQAFLAAMVLPQERTAVLGVVNTLKTMAQAVGIGTAGLFAERHFWVALFTAAGSMKAGYDLLMLWMFLGLKDRESGG